MNIRRCIIALAMNLMVLPTFVFAQDGSFPSPWPWRGISVPAELAENDLGVVKELAQLNVNVVRIFFSSNRTMEQLHISSEDAFRHNLMLVDRLLDECRNQKITAIIATDSFPTDDLKCSDKRDPAYWSNEMCTKQREHLMSIAAQRYASRGAELSAYQFLSEPVVVRNGQSLLPAGWNEILVNMLKSVRKYDTSRYVIVSAGPWGYPDGYDGFPLLHDKHIIYNAHVYEPHKYTHQESSGEHALTYPGRVGFTYWDKNALERFVLPLVRFQERNRVPLYIGEFSAVRWAPGHDRYLKDCIDIFEKHGWSWIYFAFGGKKTWTGWDPRYEGGSGTAKGRLLYKGYDTDTWMMLKDFYKRNAIEEKKRAAPGAGAQ